MRFFHYSTGVPANQHVAGDAWVQSRPETKVDDNLPAQGSRGGGGGNSVNPFEAAANSAFTSIDIGSHQAAAAPNPFLRTAANQDVAAPSAPAPAPPGAWGNTGGAGWGAAAATSHTPPAAPPSGDLPFTNSTAPAVVLGQIGAEAGKKGKKGKDKGPPKDTDTASLLPAGQGKAPPVDSSTYPFYNLRRYRPLFNVDTKEVLWRVASSLIGVVFPNFMEKTMEAPDLYGPFWVATTLIFITAVSGNFSAYLQFRSEQNKGFPPPSGLNASADIVPIEWYNDSTKFRSEQNKGFPPPSGLNASADIVPIDWYNDSTKVRSEQNKGFPPPSGLNASADVVPIQWYNDSTKVRSEQNKGFPPPSGLNASADAVPIEWYNDSTKWTLVGVATLLSAGFLLVNFKKAVMDSVGAKSIPLLILVLVVHLGLGLGLKLYFFKY
eukprot:gene24814-10462_t